MTDSEAYRFRQTINYPYNFLKHADRDPGGQMECGTTQSVHTGFYNGRTAMLQRLAGEIPFEAKVFWFWFVSKYPEGFDNLPKRRDCEDARIAIGR